MTEGLRRDAGFVVLVAAAEAIRGGAAARSSRTGGLELAGIGWATVELERAARELGAGIGIDPAAWAPAPRDALLGARAWSALAPHERGPVIVLLEPDTEGRVAASLARFGEGVAAVYLRAEIGRSAPRRARAIASAQSALGSARLVQGGPAWGPHVLVLEPRGVAGAAIPGDR